MPVSADSWKNFTASEKIDFAKRELKTTYLQLSKMLGVNQKTLARWRAGEFKMPKCIDKKLKDVCTAPSFTDIKDEAYLAFTTLSADASNRLLTNAIASGDPMMLAMATNCVALKYASVISRVDEEGKLIIKLSTLYEAVPSTVVEVYKAGDLQKDKLITLKVQPPKMAGTSFVMGFKMTDTATGTTNKIAYMVSDRALSLLMKATYKFFLA